MPLDTALQPRRPTPLWPMRSSVGPRQIPRRVNRVGRLRFLGQSLAFVLLIAVAAFTWDSWVAGGWFALAGWFVLGALSLVLVGWMLERLGLVSVVRAMPERLTRRYIWDRACR